MFRLVIAEARSLIQQRDTVERLEQLLDLPIAAVELLRKLQPLGNVSAPELEGGDGAGGLQLLEAPSQISGQREGALVAVFRPLRQQGRPRHSPRWR